MLGPGATDQVGPPVTTDLHQEGDPVAVDGRNNAMRPPTPSRGGLGPCVALAGRWSPEARVEQIRQLTAGRCADATIEAFGVPGAVAEACG